MKRGGLRQRLAWTLAATGAATALMVGLIFWLSEEAIEQAALRQLMQSELNLLSGNVGGLYQHQLFFRPARGRPPPQEWRDLPPGTFSSISYGGLPYQLLVAEAGPGDRIYLAQSLSTKRQREAWLLWALIGGVLLSALLALAASGRLSRLALQPLQALLERVRQLRPGEPGQRMAGDAQLPELDVVIQALNDYMHALDRLVEHERAFSGAAAHELQTPLSVIAGAAELLEARHAQEPALGRIRRASREASQTLDLLLALSETRDMPPAEVLDLAVELPAMAAQVPPRAGLNLQWKLPPRLQLQAPRVAVALIFLNLLRNAQRAARTQVNIEADANGLYVRDDGDGIALDLLPQVFEPGVRGPEGGSGLGLHIARRVAERLGWRLALGNHPEGGAVATWHWR